MELLIITGLSGAGKTQTLKKLEDIGYFCVDNIPSEMLPDFIKICSKANPQVNRAAVVIDSRERIFKAKVDMLLKKLEADGVRYSILYLDCNDDVLARRYSATRRKHPISENIMHGIDIEKEYLSELKERADYVIDTSEMKPVELMERINTLFLPGTDSDFKLIIESFGYKKGIPIDADFVFDMRFLPNPYYEQELSKLTGKDDAVKAFIMSEPKYNQTINSLKMLIDELIPMFCKRDKKRLLIAFGCTGGRHRSVCAAETFYELYRYTHNTKLIHRDACIDSGD